MKPLNEKLWKEDVRVMDSDKPMSVFCGCCKACACQVLDLCF